VVIGAPDLMFVGLTVPTGGKLQANVDWTLASNDVTIVGIASGPFPACSPVDFRADPWYFVKSDTSEPCPFLATIEAVATKPAKLTTVSTAAGSYTLILGSRGPKKDLVSWQVFSIPNP